MSLVDSHSGISRLRPRLLIRAAVQLGLAGCLVIDAVVHLRDAVFYGPVRGTLLSEADLFRIQAVLALAVALAVLVRPRPAVWIAAGAVAGSAVAAVVLYTYVNVGALAGLPNLYEPSWGPPGKRASAIAEGAGVLLALAGLVLAVHSRRVSSAHR